MDELATKRVLIVGDSFMKPDPYYPGQHFSEMLGNTSVHCLAQNASSNAMIAMQMFEGIVDTVDAIILGFSTFDRIEFDAVENHMTAQGWRWYSNNCIPNNKKDQKLTVDYVRATASHDMMYIKSLLLVRSCLLTLTVKKIPFAFSLNGLYDHPNNNRTKWLKQLLDDFQACEISTNLFLYPNLTFDTGPSFHVPSVDWQSQFANESMSIIEQQTHVNFFETT